MTLISLITLLNVYTELLSSSSDDQMCPRFPKRIRTENIRMADYVVTGSVGQFDWSSVNSIKVLYFETVDSVIPLPSAEEIIVAKNFFQRQMIDETDVADTTGVLKAAYDQRIAFPQLYNLAATVATFGCSSAMCESSFSTLARVDRPHRRSMLHKRLSNLVMLSTKEPTQLI